MAVVWFLAATIAAALLAAAALAIAHLAFGFAFDTRAFLIVLLPATQLCLLLACLRRAQRVGDGDIREGLAWHSVKRSGIVALLALAALLISATHVALVTLVPAYRDFFGQAQTSLPLPNGRLSVGFAAWLSLVVVVGAPVSEELFFRSWLWVGLRRWWSLRATAAATGLLWLLAHAGDGGWRRILLLVPTMILISTARAIGGSVRASMVVHVAGNATLAAVLIAAALGN